MGRKRILPDPEFVTAETDYGMAYAWKCEGYGLWVLGDTQAEARVNFKAAFLAEYNKPF